MIDYKDGKITWDTSFNWERDEHYYHYHQDILQVKYGQHCLIDVGNYSNKEPHFTIFVVDPNEEEAWGHPYACIPCQDKADMLVQLQRAINVYPKMMQPKPKE